jgi:hypothetical protein
MFWHCHVEMSNDETLNTVLCSVAFTFLFQTYVPKIKLVLISVQTRLSSWELVTGAFVLYVKQTKNTILTVYKNWYFEYTYQIIHNVCYYSISADRDTQQKNKIVTNRPTLSPLAVYLWAASLVNIFTRAQQTFF